MDSANTSTYSISKQNLGPIIWPGDSISIPKGWEIPQTGKKLRIRVPVKEGFSELVKVTHDPSTNKTQVTGYSIDVFNAVMGALPYAVSYEFIPFERANGETTGTYNDLVYQVYLGVSKNLRLTIFNNCLFFSLHLTIFNNCLSWGQ